MKHGSHFSIWLFIGILLVIYGVLILGSGLYQFVVPPENPVVLFRLHVGIWWGLLTLFIGAGYVYKFR